MLLWRQLSRGLRSLLHSRDAEQDLADEVQHYFDEAVRAGVDAGSSPEDARRAAMLEWGNPSSVRDRVRESGWENVKIPAKFEDLARDYGGSVETIQGLPAWVAPSSASASRF